MYGEKAIAEHSQLESLDARDVSSLIANGADVNYRTKEGYTSLHNAIYAGDTELVVALITAGADVNLPVADDGYNNAFELAIYATESPVILALLDAPDEWANAAGLLELAIQNELNNEVIAKLAARGADLNEVNEDGENLLYIALMNDAKYELIAYLYNQGVAADFMIDDLSPADYAKSLQRFDLVALFKSQNKSDLVAVNQPKSAFLTQFIQQESDIILKSKGNMMVKVLIATDEESKTEWHAMAENNIQLKAIDVYSKSDLFDVFLTHCPALDSDFTKKMEAVFSKYTHVKQDYIKAGAEVINNNAILTHEEKTVLSGRFAQVLVERKNTLISSFTNVTTETKSELLSQCNDAILNAEADEQLAKVNAY
ncbi:ankyrin repeat domain-containing protein [Algibacillus agarilyticus]|uniref:ankyrin repeat domain-containing protein n=1 Tax=Algibacillus agarilyticus TaxID=2234133 RepID=UPI000DD0C548|nr:ankyrin repeat domain-containing protein [Algibacillus agarilyticus]